MCRIIRVFPRRTRATPSDELVRFDVPGFFDEADEVHVSCLFSWDREKAERLARAWEHVAPVKMGGPAFNSRGEAFTPGMYVAHGYTVTSRGCPNRCWFCSVWKRDGNEVRELPIMQGHNVLDDNLLATSERHIRAVFAMLARQNKPIEFTGGLEARRLQRWHAEALRELKPKQVFFAYDTPDDLEPLRYAGKLMLSAGFTKASHVLRCYVLCGYPGDTMQAADIRMREACDSGFVPMAMLYHNNTGETNQSWRRFQRCWARPAITNRMFRDGSQPWV